MPCCSSPAPTPFLILVQTILPRFDAAVEECEYGVDVTMTVSLPDGGEGALNQALRDATAGQVEGRAHRKQNDGPSAQII